MAYTGTIITEAELALFEGANSAAGGTTEAAHNAWVAQAEAFLSDLVKFDIVTNWASILAVAKVIFTEYAGHYDSAMAVRYDMSGFTTRQEAEDMISVSLVRMEQIIKVLNDASIQDFMGV